MLTGHPGEPSTLYLSLLSTPPLSIIPPIFVSLRTDCSFAANEVVISRVSTVTPLERARRKKKKKKMGRISGVETIGECGETRGGRPIGSGEIRRDLNLPRLAWRKFVQRLSDFRSSCSVD